MGLGAGQNIAQWGRFWSLEWLWSLRGLLNGPKLGMGLGENDQSGTLSLLGRRLRANGGGKKQRQKM